jgi:hypothetical protein
MKIVIHTELFSQVEEKNQKNSSSKRKFVINYLIPLSLVHLTISTLNVFGATTSQMKETAGKSACRPWV